MGGGIFIDPGIPDAETDTLMALVASALERIDSVYGVATSKPRLLITADAEMAAKWGANDTASMHRLPWRSCIVIGPRGKNVDVIAHEWLHAEIQHRVGFWRVLNEIPVWFDEGAALTVDYRKPFMPENIDLSDSEIAAVRNLKKARDFFSGNTRLNYQAARIAVEPLIQSERFFADLDRVSAGESFESVFLNASKSIPASTD